MLYGKETVAVETLLWLDIWWGQEMKANALIGVLLLSNQLPKQAWFLSLTVKSIGDCLVIEELKSPTVNLRSFYVTKQFWKKPDGECVTRWLVIVIVNLSRV